MRHHLRRTLNRGFLRNAARSLLIAPVVVEVADGVVVMFGLIGGVVLLIG